MDPARLPLWSTGHRYRGRRGAALVLALVLAVVLVSARPATAAPRWEVPLDTLSAAARERVACMLEVPPRHAAGECGHIYVQDCHDKGFGKNDMSIVRQCLWEGFGAWREIAARFAAHYPEDWRAVLAAKGCTQTQVFLSEITPEATSARMAGLTARCDEGTDVDTLEQCLFEVRHEVAAWLDLYLKMNGPDR